MKPWWQSPLVIGQQITAWYKPPFDLLIIAHIHQPQTLLSVTVLILCSLQITALNCVVFCGSAWKVTTWIFVKHNLVTDWMWSHFRELIATSHCLLFALVCFSWQPFGSTGTVNKCGSPVLHSSVTNGMGGGDHNCYLTYILEKVQIKDKTGPHTDPFELPLLGYVVLCSLFTSFFTSLLVFYFIPPSFHQSPPSLPVLVHLV